jgi:hypothetical protein
MNPGDFRRKLRAVAGLLAVATAIGACAATPYVDSRREAGQKEPVGSSTPDLVAVCYSSYGSDRDAAQKTAESECAKTGRQAAFDHENTWACTLTASTRAFYRCVAKP